MKPKKNTIVIITVILVVMTAFAIRLVNRMDSVQEPVMTDFIRITLHIGLFTAWGFSLFHRIIQKNARHFLCGIAFLMVLWLCFKALKYYIVTDINAARYLWYLYYLPLLFIPLFTLFAALFLGKTENYRLPRWTKLLYFFAVLLLVMVMTNDCHQFVFRFPEDAVVFSDYEYQRGPGYVFIFTWFASCSLAAFTIMFFHCKVSRRQREYIPFVVSLVLSVIYVITSMAGFSITMFLAGDMSTAYCLLFSAVLESCIYCGLIPVNTRYGEMFVASVENDAQIVNEEYQVCFASAQAERIPVRMMEKARTGPVEISRGVILHSMPVNGGYVVWTENISELSKLQEELTDIKEELTERSSMLQYEYELEKKMKTVEEQNRLYDLLTSSTRKQIDWIAELMKEYEAAGEDVDKGREILSRIAILGGYVKRKKHMVLSIYSGFYVTEDELKNAFAESVHYLQFMDVRCTLLVDTGRKFIPGNIAVLAYDFFEAATEATLDSLYAMMITVTEISDVLRIRLIVGSREPMSKLQKDYPKALIELSDSDEWTLILPLNGGGS